MIKTYKTDILIISLICLYSLIIWYPTKNLPFHWDSAAFAVKAAQNFYTHGFNPFIAEYSEFAHPPLYPVLIALLWKLFGQTRFVVHLTILPFFPILLISTYFLGKKIASVTVGFCATILVAFVPFFIAEVGMPYLDLAAGSLAALSLTLWAYQRYWFSSLFLTLAVLTKNTMILMLIPLLVDLIIRRRKILNYLPLIPPILATGFWLLYHYSQANWWLTAPGRETVMPSTLYLYLNSLWFVSSVFFFRQYRFFLTFAALLSAIYLYLKSPIKLKKPLSPTVISLLLVPCSLLLFFAATGEFIPRYAIALLPAYTVLCTYLIFSAIKKPLSYLTILAIALAFLISLHPRSPTPANALELRLNEDLSYQDHIQLGVEAASYIETNYPELTIFGDFPQSYQLTEPLMGYVSKPLNFVPCDSLNISNLSSIILYTHPYHYTQIACQTLLDQHPFTLLKTFNVNGKWARIYLYESKK